MDDVKVFAKKGKKKLETWTNNKNIHIKISYKNGK